MNSRPYLSICIPTYNRKDFLINTLETISSFKESSEIEIVVADDASPDATERAVKTFILKHKNMNIVYKRFSKRMFFDKMVLSIVTLANGKYVWLISDDDKPLPGSIGKLKKIFKKYPKTSFVHMNYVRFDNLLKKVTSKRMVGDITTDVYFDNPSDFFFRPIQKSYFKFLGTNTITMSTDVVDRLKFVEVAKNLRKYIGHNFIHSFAILALIKKYPYIYYIGRPSVEYLSNNHRVWPNDIWRDYNTIFLDFLIGLGFSKSKVETMRKAQRQYEQREGIMKNFFLSKIYQILRPIYVRFQFVFSKLHEK